MKRTRILLYGDIDLNLIDGSAIWLAALAEMLSADPDFEVVILLKTPLKRHIVVARLEATGTVAFLDPWEKAKTDKAWKAVLNSMGRQTRLPPETAAQLIELHNEQSSPDLILIRPDSQTNAVAKHLVETTIPTRKKVWTYVTDAKNLSHLDLVSLTRNFRRIVCQTPQSLDYIRAKLGGLEDDGFVLLPPMIPDCPGRKPHSANDDGRRLCYCGKFSPHYYLDETLDAFERIRQEAPEAEFHVIGDKFHNNPPVPDYERKLRQRFEHMPGVVWHRAMTHGDTQDVIAQSHIAASWRDPVFDDSLELSTKVLEYAAHGLPVLMNPATVQIDLFGEDYPLYIESEDEFVEKALRLINDRDFHDAVSLRATKVASRFTYESILQGLAPAIRSDIRNPHIETSAGGKETTKILLAGHDLKFTGNIVEYFSSLPEYEVRIDEWIGHATHDELKSRKLAMWADAVYCEWCLGNARWYSKNLNPRQRLIIRVHHQEMQLEYRHQLAWENVQNIVFTNHPHYDTFKADQVEHVDKALVMYCDIDCDVLDRPKLEGAEFNLGLVGINPQRKGPHLAVEILKRLRDVDSRYNLFFKTQMPQELDWLWERASEREYYENLFRSVDDSPHRNAVVFDPHGKDMPQWFTKIGFLLSTSEHEGSHQAVAESMAAGCVPVIRHWTGAHPLYPRRFVLDYNEERYIEQAVKLILSVRQIDAYESTVDEAKAYAYDNFDVPVVMEKWARLFNGQTL